MITDRDGEDLEVSEGEGALSSGLLTGKNHRMNEDRLVNNT